MVSDAGAGGMEGWKFSIDKYSELDMCTEGAIPQEELPNVLHYCKLSVQFRCLVSLRILRKLKGSFDAHIFCKLLSC